MAKKYQDDDTKLQTSMTDSRSSSFGMAIDKDNDTVSGSVVSCAPCQLEDSTRVDAVVYCVECNEHLCSNCQCMHRKFRLSRHHQLIDRGSQQSSDITETCTDHPGNSITYFCENHQVLCCTSCLNVEHKQCLNIRNILKESKGIKDGDDLKECISALRSLSTRFEEIRSVKNQHNIDIKHQREQTIQHISQLRASVNNLFDKLEEGAKHELKHESEEIIIDNKADIDSYEDISVKLNMTVDRLITVTRSAGDGQIFVTMKRALRQIRKYDHVLNEAESNLKDIAISFVEDKLLTEFMKRLKALGNIIIDTRYKKPSPKKEQRSSISSEPKIQAVPAGGHSVRINSDKTTCNITGCSFLNDDRLVVADYNNKCIKLFDKKCQPSCHLDLTSRPYAVSTLDVSDIVTSLADEKILQLCHVDIFVHIGARIPAREKYVALTCSSRMEIYAACCFESAAGQVHVLNKNGSLMRTIGDRNTEFLRPVSVAISDDNKFLYVSDTGRNCVICIDVTIFSADSKVVFKYSDKNLELREGLTIDETGSLYVSSSNGSVHQVSYSGVKVKEILTKNDGVDVPHSMCFNRNNQTLVLFEHRENKMKMFQLI